MATGLGDLVKVWPKAYTFIEPCFWLWNIFPHYDKKDYIIITVCTARKEVQWNPHYGISVYINHYDHYNSFGIFV